MKNLSFAPILFVLTFASVPPALAQDRNPLQVTTQEYANRIKAQFDECMRPIRESGVHSGNGVILDCLPDAEDVSRVTDGDQPITSMKVCVDWSLGYMAGIIDSDKIKELNDNTKCETEGYNTYVSLYDMLGWVTTSKYEPYGI